MKLREQLRAAETGLADARRCEERSHESADLEAQWASAAAAANSAAIAEALFRWSVVEAVILCLAVGAAFWAAIEARRAANLADKSITQARQLEETASKAYLDAVSCQVTWPHSGMAGSVTIVFRNCGKAPALNVRPLLFRHGKGNVNHWSERPNYGSFAVAGDTTNSFVHDMQPHEYAQMTDYWEDGAVIGPSVSGTVFYEDIYGTLYRSTFHLLYEPDYLPAQAAIKLGQREQEFATFGDHNILYEPAPNGPPTKLQPIRHA
jgi:hypothetical protein